MSIQSGSVTFRQFRVVGDSPLTVDASVLGSLAQHSFRETEVGAPAEITAGWVGGDHFMDTKFSHEKNGFGTASNRLLFAIRIDTNKVPAEVKQAYKRINEAAVAAGSKSGFASRIEKKEAAEAADRQVQEDLAAGKYRKTAVTQLLWDLDEYRLYVGSASDKVVEQVYDLMKKTFNVDVETITAGSLVGRVLQEIGKEQAYEDLRPAQFTKAPDAPAEDSPGLSQVPLVPWTETSVNLKDFLGNELLLYLWYATEKLEGSVYRAVPETDEYEVAIVIDKALDMDCAWGLHGKQTLRGGGPTKMPEAGKALNAGKWPRKAGLVLAAVSDRLQWELTLQADKWVISGATLPDSPDAESPRELLESRLQHIIDLGESLNGVMELYAKARVDPEKWPAIRTAMKEWIKTRVKTPVSEQA